MVRPEDGDRNWYEYTHTLNKNVSHLIDKAGSIVAHYDYDAYGNMIEQTGSHAGRNPIRFSSEYDDEELGLVYYNYRHYNPKDGRWINRDPLKENGALNLYAHSNNSTTNFFDQVGKLITIIGNQYTRQIIRGREAPFPNKKLAPNDKIYENHVKDLKNMFEEIAKDYGTISTRKNDKTGYHEIQFCLKKGLDKEKLPQVIKDLMAAIDSDNDFYIMNSGKSDNAYAYPLKRDAQGKLKSSAVLMHIGEQSFSLTEYVYNEKGEPVLNTKGTPIFQSVTADKTVILWHELIGHAYKDEWHKRTTSNFRDEWEKGYPTTKDKTDPIIKTENEIREHLNKGKRAPFYYDSK